MQDPQSIVLCSAISEVFLRRLAKQQYVNYVEGSEFVDTREDLIEVGEPDGGGLKEMDEKLKKCVYASSIVDLDSIKKLIRENQSRRKLEGHGSIPFRIDRSRPVSHSCCRGVGPCAGISGKKCAHVCFGCGRHECRVPRLRLGQEVSGLECSEPNVAKLTSKK